MTQIYDRIHQRRRERFEKSLSVIFTSWQVSILQKRAQEIPLTDGERQELSRRIKPKILAMEELRDVRYLLSFFN
jgi:hypothetical protein